MGNQVIKLSDSEQARLISEYQHASVPPPPHARFCAKLPGVVITVYNSGKVMFQGGKAESESQRWGVPTQKKTSTPKASGLPEGFATWSVVGSDEVGKGDYFGPLVVVAAFVTREQIELVRELGVKDSKQLTDRDIPEIAKALHHTILYQKAVIHNPMYNQMQQTMTQGKMTAIAHNSALRTLLTKLPAAPEAILIDQFAEKNIYFNHLRQERDVVRDNVYFSTKAEGLHVAVAAASILARAFFLKEMDKISERIGMDIPKGAGAKVDQAAARILERHGEETLRSVVKWHFANTEKAKKLLAKKRS